MSADLEPALPFRIGVVINPRGRTAADATARLASLLPDATRREVHEDEDVLDVARSVAQAHDVVGVVGGDGTVNAAATAALAAGKPLAVFPGGTLNHFARDLGLATVDDTVGALRSGSTRAVHVAVADDRLFCNTASIGAYTELVDRRERLEQRLPKWPAFAVALVQTLRAAKPVEVVVDGTPRSLWLLFVGNGEYRPTGLAPLRRDDVGDGRLDVRWVEHTGRFSRVRAVAAALTDRADRTRTMARHVTVRIDLRSVHGPMRLARDGETCDVDAEIAIRVVQRPLVVYATARTA